MKRNKKYLSYIKDNSLKKENIIKDIGFNLDFNKLIIFYEVYDLNVKLDIAFHSHFNI